MTEGSQWKTMEERSKNNENVPCACFLPRGRETTRSIVFIVSASGLCSLLQTFLVLYIYTINQHGGYLCLKRDVNATLVTN